MSEEHDKSLNTALASARMEGFQVTPQIIENCKRIISGEISVSEYISQVTEASATARR